MTGASGGAYHRRVISHDLHALGFDAPDLDALVNSAAEAGAVGVEDVGGFDLLAAYTCLLYTSPSPRDVEESRMPSSA